MLPWHKNYSTLTLSCELHETDESWLFRLPWHSLPYLFRLLFSVQSIRKQVARSDFLCALKEVFPSLSTFLVWHGHCFRDAVRTNFSCSSQDMLAFIVASENLHCLWQSTGKVVFCVCFQESGRQGTHTHARAQETQTCCQPKTNSHCAKSTHT